MVEGRFSFFLRSHLAADYADYRGGKFFIPAQDPDLSGSGQDHD
jgi:hypothetical protein